MPRVNGYKNKVGVIGTINRDTVVRADASVIQSWGGILYNLKTLNDFSNLTIYPAVNIGADCQPRITKILSGFKNVDRSFVRTVNEKNNHCFLSYNDQSDKSEILKGGVPPLLYRDIVGLLDSDMVLVNFISGRDVGLRALEKFRQEFSGTIYIDLHSLTLGRKKLPDGLHRYLRRPRLWKRYAACADILQVNRVEFELLSGGFYSEDNARRFFQTLLVRQPRTKCLIVTLGDNGCLVVTAPAKSVGQPKVVHVPAEPVPKIYDTTGCGDIFSAGFIGAYLINRDEVASAQAGNHVAARRCRAKYPMF